MVSVILKSAILMLTGKALTDGENVRDAVKTVVTSPDFRMGLVPSD